MYSIDYTNEFKKQAKLMQKRGCDMELLNEAIRILMNTGTLPADKYKTHKLKGNYKNLWEAHLQPDWLLIWHINKNLVTIVLTHTGTHSDLFR
ncbi:MAG: type II toxin-antitoxin system YafQ family toxin [Flavobacteriaceae bacterium]|jgi:mRNA interferase YafQ|nr:type II toxin-antitoxin system YafQ family toxin [Flavobacteriaceae bacterium]